jgi:hypothetical protein
MYFLVDVLQFVLHWYHAAALLLGLGYTFRSGWQKLGDTEDLAREALQLSPDNPEREEVAVAIHKAQRSAIFQMRFCLLTLAGMLWLILS